MAARQCDTVFLITLAGSMDDLPVAIFDTRAGVDAFLRTNRPCPTDGRGAIHTGPLGKAAEIAGRGPSSVLGYQVWQFTDGQLVRAWNRRWLNDSWPPVRATPFAEAEAIKEETNEPWDKPATPPGSPQEEWSSS